MREWLAVATPYEIGVWMARESVSKHLGILGTNSK